MDALATTVSNPLVVINAPPLDQNPAAVYLASLSPNSRRTMRVCLNSISYLLGLPSSGKSASTHTSCFEIDWGAMRFQHTAAIRTKIAERYQMNHANKMLFALRGVLKAAWRLGYMPAEAYHRAVEIERIKGDTLPRGRALTEGEITALLDACAQDPSPAGMRDGALIALLRVGGLRRAEVCSLRLEDYDQANETLIVRGKGNKERTAYLETGAAAALSDWLSVRGQAPGPLFCPVEKGGKVELRALTPQAIYNALAKRAQAAGVKDLSPHDFRRTFVSDLLDAGADISTVQRLAGHANVNTTARYDRRGEMAKRKAVGLLHVPYRRSGRAIA